MAENKKGLIQLQDQAIQNNNVNNQQINNIRVPNKKERTLMLLLRSPFGLTENHVLRDIRISNARNYFTEAERKLSISLGRIELENPDGIGDHYKYWIACRDDAMKIATLINQMRIRRKADPLSGFDIELLISRYPEAPEQAA